MKQNSKFMEKPSRADRLAYYEKMLTQYESIKHITDEADSVHFEKLSNSFEIWTA